MADTITVSFILESAPGTRWTGQGANLNFRISPYGGGNTIAGLTFTETPASSGVYVVTGLAAYYQNVKCFVTNTEITALGIFDCGDPDHAYLLLDGTNAMSAILDMGTHRIKNISDGTTSGD